MFKFLFHNLFISFVCLFYKWTFGFTSFTTAAYVLNSAGSSPRKTPELKILDQNGQQLSTNELFKNKYVLLNFMYFHCPYVCSSIMAKLTTIHNHLTNNQLKKLIIVSISIDPNHDTSEILNQVWKTHDQPKIWHFVSLADEINKDSSNNLSRFGVWIYQRPDGFFNHSTYLFLLDPNGNIIHIFNAEQNNDEIIRTMEEIIT
ncbi:MAG: SCO family protein [Gammaproteobacteria bacterium]|nr:SCO family protein [Gammaproteobacteria bacterium]